MSRGKRRGFNGTRGQIRGQSTSSSYSELRNRCSSKPQHRLKGQTLAEETNEPALQISFCYLNRGLMKRLHTEVWRSEVNRLEYKKLLPFAAECFDFRRVTQRLDSVTLSLNFVWSVAQKLTAVPLVSSPVWGDVLPFRCPLSPTCCLCPSPPQARQSSPGSWHLLGHLVAPHLQYLQRGLLLQQNIATQWLWLLWKLDFTSITQLNGFNSFGKVTERERKHD